MLKQQQAPAQQEQLEQQMKQQLQQAIDDDPYFDAAERDESLFSNKVHWNLVIGYSVPEDHVLNESTR